MTSEFMTRPKPLEGHGGKHEGAIYFAVFCMSVFSFLFFFLITLSVFHLHTPFCVSCFGCSFLFFPSQNEHHGMDTSEDVLPYPVHLRPPDSGGPRWREG